MKLDYWLAVGTLCLAFSGGAIRADDPPLRTTPFPDVPKTHWAYDAVESLRQKGILRGYPPEAAKAKDAAKKPRKPAQQSRKRRSA